MPIKIKIIKKGKNSARFRTGCGSRFRIQNVGHNIVEPFGRIPKALRHIHEKR